MNALNPSPSRTPLALVVGVIDPEFLPLRIGKALEPYLDIPVADYQVSPRDEYEALGPACKAITARVRKAAGR